MAALAVVLCQHVEEERLHVIVQRLVIQKELGQQTQVLTVDSADIPIHLEQEVAEGTVPSAAVISSQEALDVECCTEGAGACADTKQDRPFRGQLAEQTAIEADKVV